MWGSDDEPEAEVMWRLEDRRRGVWGRLGCSAETVYWAIFGLGLAVLAVLIVELVAGLGA